MAYTDFIPSIHPALNLLLLGFLVLTATLRLTRLATTDTIGEWLLRRPLGYWAAGHERTTREARKRSILTMMTEHSDMTDEAKRYLEARSDEMEEDDWVSWQGRLVSGLWCPHCVGFWIGAAMVVLTVVLIPLQVAGFIWLILLSILSLSYVVGHLSARLD